MLAERYFKTSKGHAGWLMPLVDSTLAELGAGPGDIGLVAVGTGPGTFTGVKVGVATAVAVACGLGVPLVGVPTLDTLACTAGDAGPVLSVIDARRGMLYAAIYRTGGARPERLTEFMCRSPEDVADAALLLGPERITLAGEAPGELVSMLERGCRVQELGGPFPSGRLLYELALEMRDEGITGSSLSVSPIYLKKPV